ncbi:unnamed protein product [Prunus armeniaca]|uniref:Uncharacterized protein n=1 Tax=Prunus armeniaca TaxID=36596 RepID=A0A6J5Y193_PRUAR|nr:unnamed protein product [Prunus armeniaca]
MAWSDVVCVAVPFPGRGAWTGAIIDSILSMPLWAAVFANFFGIVLAGLLVNLLVNIGLKYAIITGIILFIHVEHPSEP